MAEPGTVPKPDLTPAQALRGLDEKAGGPDVWRALGTARLIASAYHHGDPGSPVDPAGLGRILAAADERVGIGATLSVCVQLASCLPLLSTGGAAARELLAGALTGERLVALAATDDVAGSDLTALHTTLRGGPDGLEVTGAKQWVTNATTCAAFLVLARVRPGRHFTNFAWVLVPVHAPGVTVDAADTDLFEGSGTGHLRLDHVRLTREHLVGRMGRGLTSFAASIAVERLAGALWAVALCRRVLIDTKRRLEARPYGEHTLWHLDAVRQKYGECVVAVRQLDALARQLGDAVAARRDLAAGAVLKASAAMTVDRVLGHCAQLHGAEGFSRNGIQRLRSQAALFGIGGGVTEVVLAMAADSADAHLAALAPRAADNPAADTTPE